MSHGKDFGTRCLRFFILVHAAWFVLQQIFRCLATERSRVQVIGGSPALKVSVTGQESGTAGETSDSEGESRSLYVPVFASACCPRPRARRQDH